MGTGLNWHARYLQQATWTRDLRAYLFERAGLAQAKRVLEVGCGTGAILSAVGAPGLLHGLDIEPASLAEARRHAPAAALSCGDALCLPYPPGVFDITFCHFLLLWVGDPLGALVEMKRVTRRGGALLALAEPDYTARVDEPPALAALGNLQTESLRRQGADPAMGSRLAESFSQAGIRLAETGRLQNGAPQPQPPHDWEMEWSVLESDLTGMLSPTEMRRYKELDRLSRQRQQRVLYVPTYFAWGQVC